jgi:hypothetical protein
MPDLLDTPPAEPTPATPAPAPATLLDAPASGTPAPAPTDWKKDLPDGWISALGDNFAPHAEALKNFKSVDDLAKSYLHFRKTGPAYPTEDSTPQDIERFRVLANVPATPEGYGLTKPENLPAGAEWDESIAAEIAAVAHKHHVPAPALKALADAQLAAETRRAEAYAKEQVAAQEKLRAELTGLLGTGETWTLNAGNIRHTIGTLAEKANIDPQDPGIIALFSNGSALKIFHQISQMMNEDGARRPTGYGDLRNDRQRAQDIMDGKDSEWGAKYKAGDKEAIARVARLLQSK